MLMISYQPLWDELQRLEMDKQELKTRGIVNHSTLYKLMNSEPVSMTILMRLCDALDIPVEGVVRFKKL